MDIMKKVEQVANKLMSDKKLMEKFKAKPVSVIEELLGVDLPDDFMEKVVDGQATIPVPVKELGSGTYKLVIHAFVGGAKAEQPLTMSGTWEMEFSR